MKRPSQLPLELQAHKADLWWLRSLGGRRRMFAGVALAIIIILGAWSLLKPGGPGAPAVVSTLPTASPVSAALLYQASPSAKASSTPRHTSSMTPTSTLTPTQTETPTKAITLTATAGPGLETPIASQLPFLIHQVHPGESIAFLEDNFLTSEAAIRTANGIGNWPLWVGQLVVIPAGITETEGLPRFEIYQVPEGGRTVQQIIELFGADSQELRRYNSLGEGPNLPGGRWLIIPLPTATQED